MNRQLQQVKQTRDATGIKSSGRFGRLLLLNGLIVFVLAVMVGCVAQKNIAPDATSNTATKTMLIPVEGMSCGSCAATVKRAVKAIDGVAEVEISLEHRNARVRYVEGKVSPDRIVAAINQLGYKAGRPQVEP